jgi:hypothetical protein
MFIARESPGQGWQHAFRFSRSEMAPRGCMCHKLLDVAIAAVPGPCFE